MGVFIVTFVLAACGGGANKRVSSSQTQVFVSPQGLLDMGAYQVFPSRLIVRFHDAVLESRAREVIAEMDGVEMGLIEELGFWLIEVDGVDLPTLVLARDLWEAHPDVEVVEFDGAFWPEAVPTDPQYNQQWYAPQIGLESAWNTTTGDASQTVAIIDSGVGRNPDSTHHEDLGAKLHPVQGHDFIDGDELPWDVSASCAPNTRSYGHGTHVGGTVAAATNNGAGVAGVAWDTKLAFWRVFPSCGGASGYDIWQSVVQASNRDDVRVINLSLGGGGFASLGQEVYTYAWSHGKVVVAAAGNDDISTVQYPAAYDHVLSVSALAQDGCKAYYSNFGNWVDISAPGGDGFKDTVIRNTYFDGSTTNLYDNLQGTSMATPVVAGVAALVAAAHSGWGPDQILDQLVNTADATPLGQGCNNTYSGKLGSGRVDAASALGPDTTPPVLLGAVAQSPTEVDLIFSEYMDTSTALNPASYTIVGSGSPVVHRVKFQMNRNRVTLVTDAQAGTAYTVTVSGPTDLSGNAVAGGSSANWTGTTLKNWSLEAGVTTSTDGHFYTGAQPDKAVDGDSGTGYQGCTSSGSGCTPPTCITINLTDYSAGPARPQTIHRVVMSGYAANPTDIDLYVFGTDELSGCGVFLGGDSSKLMGSGQLTDVGLEFIFPEPMDARVLYLSFPNVVADGTEPRIKEVEAYGANDLERILVATGVNNVKGSWVRKFTPQGAQEAEWKAYWLSTDKNQAHVAVGNVDMASPGAEIVVSDGLDGLGRLSVWNSDGTVKLREWQVWWSGGNAYGEIQVTTGDVDGDGIDEIITGLGERGIAHVRTYEGDGTLIDRFVGSYYAPDPNDQNAFGTAWRTEIHVATWDFDNDGDDEIVISHGDGGKNLVRVFDYLGQPFGWNRSVLGQFFPFNLGNSQQGEVLIGAGDVDGDGVEEIVTGQGIGGFNKIRIFENDLSTEIATDWVFSSAENPNGEVHLAVGDLDGDGVAEIIVGTGEGGTNLVKVFKLTNGTLVLDSSFSAFGNFHNGGGEVHVAVGRL